MRSAQHLIEEAVGELAHFIGEVVRTIGMLDANAVRLAML